MDMDNIEAEAVSDQLNTSDQVRVLAEAREREPVHEQVPVRAEPSPVAP